METKEILSIIEKFNSTNLTDFKYREGSIEISLSRTVQGTFVAAPVAVQTQAPAPLASTSVNTVQAEETPPLGELITSPIVGTMYRSAAPDAPAFVEPGKLVKKGETLCVIEAMKVMNEFQAEFDCEILKVLVDNGTLLEYGTPVFEVKRK